MMWSLEMALVLCRDIEAICPQYGCHVALTGGVLYKDGQRKDLDVLFYKIRQRHSVDVDGLFVALRKLGIVRVTEKEQWCIKAKFGPLPIDCFFPDADAGEYPVVEPELGGEGG